MEEEESVFFFDIICLKYIKEFWCYTLQYRNPQKSECTFVCGDFIDKNLPADFRLQFLYLRF